MVTDLTRLACASLVLVLLDSPRLEAQAPASFMETVRMATVAIGVIRQPAPNGPREYSHQGTGMIFQAPGDPYKLPWLVTAKHVFENATAGTPRRPLRLRFAWFDKQSLADNPGVELPVEDAKGPLWHAHPDPEVDLVAVPILVPTKALGRESIAIVPFTHFASAQDVFEGANVFVFGYPEVAGPQALTRAILRSGIVAWIDPENAVDRRLMIDATIFPGNSGGPVMRNPIGINRDGKMQVDGQVSFLGIVTSVRVLYSPAFIPGGRLPSGEIRRTPVPKLESRELAGLAVVEPAAGVRALLELAAKRSRLLTPK